MSKIKIFAKYLPAEGEIKRGDYNKQTIFSRYGDRTVIGLWNDDKPPIGNKLMSFQKVDRFAVTTDIAEGNDLCVYMTGEPWGKLKSLKKIKDRFYAVSETMTIWWDENAMQPLIKILAPLSPHVTWEISDGQEIEIELGYDKWHKFEVKKGESPFEPVTCKVKGPCGHYH